MKQFTTLLKIIFLIFHLALVSSDAVCDEELLILELKQDLADNGILDCLR